MRVSADQPAEFIFGVAPAWIAAQARPADALRSGSRSTASGASVLQRVLVVLQAALSLVLLVGAGLFVQNLNKLESMDLKLDSKNRYIIHINPQAAGYSQRQLEALYHTMEERFHAIPGVLKVGISNYTPMEDNNWGNSVGIEGEPDPHDGASFIKATAEYFDSVGTKVVMGRGIGVQDTSTAPPVAVVNQAFVNRFLKDKNPIGRRMGSPNHPGDFEIVGVVEDTAYTDVRWKDHTMYFIPQMQRFASDKDPIETDTSLYAGAMVIQTSRSMSDMESLARKTLAGINQNLTVVKFQTFDEQIAERFTEERLIARLTTLFGGLALLLAAIGLYGVTAYMVVRRTPEIGIRMALGAERGSVIIMIMRGALLQTALGLAIGIPVALLSIRFVKTQLYEITSVDWRPSPQAAITTLGCCCLHRRHYPSKAAPHPSIRCRLARMGKPARIQYSRSSPQVSSIRFVIRSRLRASFPPASQWGQRHPEETLAEIVNEKNTGSSRRNFLKTSGLAVIGSTLIGEGSAHASASSDARAEVAQTGAQEDMSIAFKSPVDAVNVLQGTDSTPAFSRGNTLPIAALPFGMAHWTLQSAANTPWMFNPGVRRIQGLRCTHQLSPWLDDYGHAVFLPFCGETNPEAGARASSYRPEDARLTPYSLELFLLRYRAKVELIPTDRCCLLTADSRKP